MSKIFGWIFFIVIIYSMYWVFKTVSYEIFYESMVQETVIEMMNDNGTIKQQYLLKATP